MSSKMLSVTRFSLGGLAAGFLAATTLLALPIPSHAMRVPRYAEQTRTTPPTAFLHNKVYSTERLLAQLAVDPGARKGYAKLFHISSSQVVAYIKRNCAETTLVNTGRFTVYRVTSQGTIYPTLQKVPRGATVFAVKTAGSDLPRFISSMGDPMKPYATAVSVRVVHVPAKTKVVTEVSPSQETLVPTDPVQTVVVANSASYSLPAANAEPASSQPATTLDNGVAK